MEIKTHPREDIYCIFSHGWSLCQNLRNIECTKCPKRKNHTQTESYISYGINQKRFGRSVSS